MDMFSCVAIIQAVLWRRLSHPIMSSERETGKCKIFIRPLQSVLDLTPDACEEEKEVKLLLTNLQYNDLIS